MLAKEVVRLLKPEAGDSYLDLTAGYGGHASVILDKTDRMDLAVLVDRDQAAIKELKQLFGPKGPRTLKLDFLAASEQLLDENKQFDLLFADLGVSSPHLNEGQRGFSFQQDGPLDMRMDQSSELTADVIVNHYPKDQLAELIKEFGEEPKALVIAEAIVNNRPFKSTVELGEAVRIAYGGHTRHHPATRTFQAIRIAVNDELTQLSRSLPLWLKLLAPSGRMVIITFHSLEDRLVKQFLAEHGGNRYDAELKLLNRHPIRASPSEIVNNPRARSAKLRAAVKINK